MCVHFTHRGLYYSDFQRIWVATKKDVDENGVERKSLFKPKASSWIEGNGAEADILKEVLERKKEEKIISRDIEPKRVKDLLKSFSKFDEDIMRLQGIENVNSEDGESINKLSIEEMQKELQEYLLKRDRIKINLDNLVMRVNKTSNELEEEEDKIKKLTQEIQSKVRKQFSDLGDM